MAGRRSEKRIRGKRVNMFKEHKPSPEKDSYISWIN
jgi:hypothetical protein